jgi:hypothetical protein
MAVKFSDFGSSSLNSTGFIVGYDSATNLNIRIPKSTLDSTYQSTLVSGTNIKTINGASVLGSGDLVVSGSNIYTADGSLTGARTLTLNSNPLTIAGTTSSRFFANGNLGVGTTTDAGFKADINGTTRIGNVLTTVGTVSSDNATTGPELATTASGTNWVGTSLPIGYQHTQGSAAPLTSAFTAVFNTLYIINYSAYNDPDTGTGSISSITFGGQALTALDYDGNTFTASFRATTSTPLVVTPTSDYSGGFSASIKVITASTPSIIYQNSSGQTVCEFRSNLQPTNLFFGARAGENTLTNGIANVFIGNLVGQNNTFGGYNTFLGFAAGNRNTSGNYNTSIGASSGVANISGSENTYIGYQAGNNSVSGNQNVFIGFASGRSNTTGSNNALFGHQSGYNNTTGIGNTFIGNNAGLANTTASQNTFIGSSAGQNNTSGNQNTYVGHQAGNSNSSGTSITAIGFHAGLGNTASQVTFIGTEAGRNNGNGSSNTYIGYRAGFASSGSNGGNTYVGNSVGSAQTTAFSNTCIGDIAAQYISTTNGMVAIGRAAARLFGNLNNSNTAGGGNGIYIGQQVNTGTNSSSNEIVIGALAVGLGTNTTLLGNDSTTLTGLKGNVVIGTTVNNAAAQLQVDSTTRGFLPPRMDTTQKNAIVSPPEGLVIYDTTLKKLCVRGASAWQTITSV